MRVVIGLIVVAACLLWLLARRYLTNGGWKVLPVLIAVPALALTANEYRWYSFEHQLTNAAQPVLAGRASGFGCERLMRNFWSSQAHPGHVWFDADGTPAKSAFLSMGTCAKVKSWRTHPGTADLDEIVAVHTVTHEAAHLAGERDEAAAECTAIQADQLVMMGLGATAAQAQADVVRYLTDVYPRLPADYTGDCPAATALAALVVPPT